MRIQYLAVIFVIIVLPISLVISLYTGNLIKVSNTEAQYNRILFNATHDAVRTYQMNTLDNTYAAEDTSKFRDVNASVNSFYNNLATGLSRSGYSKEELHEHVPAILFNLYDGFYIYSPYENIAFQNGDINTGTGFKGASAYSKIDDKKDAEKKNILLDASKLDYYNESATLTNTPEFGLQNYNYYACEYKGKTKDGNGKYDIVINYTLDNYMRVYGTITDKDENTKFYNYEGYYIYTAGVNVSDESEVKHNYKWTITQNGISVDILPERLGEFVAYYDPYTVYFHKPGKEGSDGLTQRVVYQKKGHQGIQYFNYIVYNGVKYYLDTDHLSLRNPETADGSLAGDINVKTGEPYNTNKYKFIQWYKQTGLDGDQLESEKDYNVSFNNTYVGIPIFKTEGKQRIYVSKSELAEIIKYMDGYYGGMTRDSDNGGTDEEINQFFNDVEKYWKDLNNMYYYTNAYDFSKKVNENIFSKIDINLNPNDNNYSVVSDAYNTKYTAYFEFDDQEGKNAENENERYYLHEKYNYGDDGGSLVFHSWGATGTSIDLVDPDLDTSLFNQHRQDVIISCIEYSFASAVENFNEYMQSSYKYKVPDISETDWGRICSNMSCLSMMQGMPIGNYKFYNNYSLVVDNKVNEYTPKISIYVEDNYQLEIDGGGDNNTIVDKLKYADINDSLYKTGKYTSKSKETREVIYHNPGCSEYNQVVGTSREVMGYRLIDYDIDSYIPPSDLKGYLSYSNGTITIEAEPPNDNVNRDLQQIFFYIRPGTGCYNCVVSQNKLDISIDEILSFKTQVTLGNGEVVNVSNNVRQAYMRALARERGAKNRFTKDTSGNRNFGSYQATE